MAEEKKNDMVSKMEAYIDKSRRVCPLSKTMIGALVKQMGEELFNKHLYMTFANYFATNGLSKLEEYYNKRAEEEELHHKWINWYLTYNDAEFQYPEVPAVDITIKSMIQPFELTVDKEIETTMHIDEIINLAIEEKDWATFNWLMDDEEETGALRKEQIEEESISRAILDMASADCSWLSKQKDILEFYNGGKKCKCKK